MKILAYEHITGGGMLGDAQMSALAPEGEAMLRALLDDLTAIRGVEVAIMRDARLGADLPATLYSVCSASDFWPAIRRAVRDADAVWPIAPEQGGMLLRITDEILQAARVLLGCRPDAVKIATSKRATADVLSRAGIAAIPTYFDERSIPPEIGEMVVKPDDGAGCQDTLLFRSRRQLQAWLRNHARAGFVFQPYVHGDARSLSLLCCDGRARLLACNRQQVELEHGVFRFDGVSVNAVADGGGRYAMLASEIARALPGLWGYCGVDFIETDSGPVVIEVNPRLTTSYAGLRRATGINPAQLVLELPVSLEAVAGAMHRTRAVEVEVARAG
jgi:tyramine---L-glutamate ligase